MTTPILSTAHMKTVLDVSPRSTEYDKRIAGLILATTRSFERACRRGFARNVVTERRSALTNHSTVMSFYGDSDRAGTEVSQPTRFLLACDPVDPGQPVEVRYDRQFKFGDDTVVPSDGYVVDYEAGTLFLTYPTVRSTKSIRISYTAGYPVDEATGALAEDTCPPDLALACETQVVRLWNARNVETEGTEKSTSSAVAPILAKDVQQMLLPFRRILVGAN